MNLSQILNSCFNDLYSHRGIYIYVYVPIIYVYLYYNKLIYLNAQNSQTSVNILHS